MFDCCSVRFVFPFSKKSQTFKNGQKSRENRTNMDKHFIIFSQASGQTWYHTNAYHLSALEMQSRYRDNEDSGGPRILESQPEYSQDSQCVDDELSVSFDDSTNVRSKDFISRDT